MGALNSWWYSPEVHQSTQAHLPQQGLDPGVQTGNWPVFISCFHIQKLGKAVLIFLSHFLIKSTWIIASETIVAKGPQASSLSLSFSRLPFLFLYPMHMNATLLSNFVSIFSKPLHSLPISLLLLYYKIVALVVVYVIIFLTVLQSYYILGYGLFIGICAVFVSFYTQCERTSDTLGSVEVGIAESDLKQCGSYYPGSGAIYSYGSQLSVLF